MRVRQRTWAVVLAAGDGTRLARLTTDERGNAIPKQYCSLDGGNSLLQEALQRGRSIAPRERLCAIVAQHHRRYWQAAIWSLPGDNIVVQPQNRGTAVGILLALLTILERDPLARIVFLPADHHVRDERLLAASLRAVATQLMRNPKELCLVGIEPEEPDTELGYILPAAALGDGASAVERFIEKPEADMARHLIRRGALWNSFIFGAHGPALLGLLRARLPQLVDDMSTALARERQLGARSQALDALYEQLPQVDFSREIMQRAAGKLRVITAGPCGWSDLGTPQRVAATLRRLDAARERTRPAPVAVPAFVNLAAQHARLQMAG
jgi:mannose-1-phosphate guanylyltransferase